MVANRVTRDLGTPSARRTAWANTVEIADTLTRQPLTRHRSLRARRRARVSVQWRDDHGCAASNRSRPDERIDLRSRCGQMLAVVDARASTLNTDNRRGHGESALCMRRNDAAACACSSPTASRGAEVREKMHKTKPQAPAHIMNGVFSTSPSSTPHHHPPPDLAPSMYARLSRASVLSSKRRSSRVMSSA